MFNGKTQLLFCCVDAEAAVCYRPKAISACAFKLIRVEVGIRMPITKFPANSNELAMLLGVCRITLMDGISVLSSEFTELSNCALSPRLTKSCNTVRCSSFWELVFTVFGTPSIN